MLKRMAGLDNITNYYILARAEPGATTTSAAPAKPLY